MRIHREPQAPRHEIRVSSFCGYAFSVMLQTTLGTTLRTLSLSMGILAGIACGEETRSPPSRGVAPTVAQLPTDIEQTKNARSASPTSMLLDGYMRPTLSRSAEPTEAAAEQVERDLGAELVAALGNPASCGDLGGVNPRTLAISASLASDGRVSSGQIAGDIPAATRDCLVERLRGHTFEGPLPEGQRQIRGELHVRGSETTREERIADPAFVAPITRDQQRIAGPNGQEISMSPSLTISEPNRVQEIRGPQGQEIAGPSGQMIAGPSGMLIGVYGQ